MIEFLANSTIENQYLVADKGSGCAPNVRFGGTWTCKFDLSTAESATPDVCVGAHEAKQWG